ncbi:hypothetical protein [Helicobacter sp. 23-1045]
MFFVIARKCVAFSWQSTNQVRIPTPSLRDSANCDLLHESNLKKLVIARLAKASRGNPLDSAFYAKFRRI